MRIFISELFTFLRCTFKSHCDFQIFRFFLPEGLKVMEKSRLMVDFNADDFPPSYFSVIQKPAKAASPPYPVTPESNPPYPVTPEFDWPTRVLYSMPKPMQIPMPSPSRNRNSVSLSGSEVNLSTARQSPHLVPSLERNSPNYESFVMVPRIPRKPAERLPDVAEITESRNAEEKKKWIGLVLVIIILVVGIFVVPTIVKANGLFK